MARCFIGLGSNLQQPLQQVSRAVDEIAALSNSQLLAVSRWYQSTAIGPGKQNDYVNGVAAIDTSLQPLELLAALQNIEKQHQRKRIERWGPRTLDLDLLLYGQQQIDLEQLTVPHPRIGDRNFVLQPLADIDADLALPDGQVIADLLKACGQQGLHLVDPASYPTIGASQQ
ncbi:MAG: 2-amino-4-hydroxy-6-hydroxymethyldihydropteridine diphosphokinase [Oceanicoccus sp.]|jgi:2-amino-4-hydroxy-6-hydroxymethyldihydropteridine diphosphokinase